MTTNMTTNPYLDMPIERVREDALAGVSLARVLAATSDYFRGRTRPGGRKQKSLRRQTR